MIDIDGDAVEGNDQPPSYSTSRKILNILTHTPIVLDTLASAAELSIGASKMLNDNYKLFGYLTISSTTKTALSIAIPATYVIQEWTINREHTMPGLYWLAQMIHLRKIPRDETGYDPDWPKLSKKQEFYAASIALPVALFTAFAHGVAAYQFSQALPMAYEFQNNINENGWLAFSILLSGNTFISSFASLGKAVIEHTRKRFAKDHLVNHQTKQYCCVSIIGYPFSLISASESVIEMFYVLQAAMRANTKLGEYILFGNTFIFIGISDIYFYGVDNLKTLNRFIEKITTKVSKKEVVAFITAIKNVPKIDHTFFLPRRVLLTTFVSDRRYFPAQNKTYFYFSVIHC